MEIKNNVLLTNNIYKLFFLEASTEHELAEKVKDTKLTLMQLVTNAYRISSLTLKEDDFSFSSNSGKYETTLLFTFSGHKKTEISRPDETLQYLNKLSPLLLKKQQESHVVNKALKHKQELTHYTTIIIEAISQEELNGILSEKQKEMLKQFITKKNLTNIKFNINSKHKDNITGKTILSISVNYACIEEPIKKIEHNDKDEQNL